MAPGDLEHLDPAEFCALERQLVAAMTMRKKRRLAMEPSQMLRIQLLEHVACANPAPSDFAAALAAAVVDVSGGIHTGPAQAVASDLQMDWQLACTSPGFRAWLRQAAAASPNG